MLLMEVMLFDCISGNKYKKEMWNNEDTLKDRQEKYMDNDSNDISVNTGLLVVNDEETILQFMAVKEDFPEIESWNYIVSSEYNSYESLGRVCKICERYNGLNKRVRWVKKEDFSIYKLAILVSGYEKDTERFIYTYLNDTDLVLLDKGVEELVESSFKHDMINKRSIKYTYDTKLLASNNFKEIRQLNISKEIELEYRKLLEDSIETLDNLSNTETVLFSSSDIYDFDDRIHDKINHYLEDNYKDKKVAIKRHPRDFVRYNPDNVKVQYIPDNLTNTIVANDVDVPETWVYPSSLLLRLKDKNIKVLDFKHITDVAYRKLINIMKDNGLTLVEV